MPQSPTAHAPTFIAELRSLPTEDGWACYEATGRACFVCSCGTTTGFVDKADAASAAEGHQWPPPAADPGERS